MKKFLNAILAICLALFVIGSSVIIAMNIKSIYYNDIDKLNIESMSNLSREDIIENYDYLIDYNLSWKATAEGAGGRGQRDHHPVRP